MASIGDPSASAPTSSAMRIEFSWHKELFDGKYNLVPSVRDQGDRHTCVFQALSASGEMESKRYAAVRNKTCSRKVLTDSFIEEYEKSHGSIPTETTRKTRLPTALELFRSDGVLAECEGKTQKLKLCGYKSRAQLPFHEIASIISEGRPIVGSIRVDDSFTKLQPDQIYAYNESKARKTDTGDHCSHAVVFIGYGWAEEENAEYLVFINSHGQSWCDEGIGRVYFEHARDLFTIDLDL